MEILSLDNLVSTFVNNINTGSKISFLIGAGVSKNTNEKGKPNGIGVAEDFIEEFKTSLETKVLPNSEPVEIDEKDIKSFKKRLKNSKFKYSEYAKFFEDNGVNIGNAFFKPVICDIVGLERLKEIKEDKYIYEYLNLKENLVKVELNKGLTQLGKLLPLIDDKLKIYTSNIDPFIEIVAKRNDKRARAIHYHYEASKTRKLNEHPFIIEHYHGYWLDGSIHENLIREKNTSNFTDEIKKTNHLYVIGYGGWYDSMYEGIVNYLSKDSSHPCVVHWAFFEEDLSEILEYDIYKYFNRDSKKYLKLYKGVDSNILFERLYSKTLNKKLNTLLNNSISKVNVDYNLPFDNVPFKYSPSFDSRASKKIRIDDVVNFSYRSYLKGKKIAISSNFGLGKSALINVLSNNIIDKKGKVPLRINLKDKEINLLNKGDIYSFILNEIRLIAKEKDSKNELIVNNFFVNNNPELKEILKRKLENKDIILILDGLDESNYRADKISEILNNLINIKYPFIFSFRTEFHQLLDCFIDNSELLKENDFVSIELVDWQKEDSVLYLKNSDLEKENIEKINSNHTNLLKRPIFLNLLKTLYANQTIVIQDNISHLYSNFISNCIYLHLNQFIAEKKIPATPNTFGKEIYNLIIEIAISLYLEYRHFIENESEKNSFTPKISFSKETLRLIISKYKYLNPDLFVEFIEFTSKKNELNLFKKQGKGFTFFHRSIFDYLVANGAAKSIVKKAKCSNAWNVYQTDEISDYFVDEIKNFMSLSDNGSNEIVLNNIITAFKHELEVVKNIIAKNELEDKKTNKQKELDLLDNRSEEEVEKIHRKYQILEYSERLEEVIFYCGKYYPNNSICSDLEFIHFNKYFFPTKYFRTTAITLSRLYNEHGYPEESGFHSKENNFPIYEYLSRLFYDLTTPTRMFYNMQRKIDVEYYGKEELYSKSSNAVDNLISINNPNEISPLDLLKAFSYFLTLDIKNYRDYNSKKKKLNQLINSKRKKKSKLFDDFIDSLDFMFYRKSYLLRNNLLLSNDYTLQVCIDSAIEKRTNLINKNNNIIRLFNGIGDGLDSLYIDYYNGNVVIQLDTRLLDIKIDLIKNRILNYFKRKSIESICVKYTWWETSRKHIPPKFIYGIPPENLVCQEGNLKFYVNIESSKTGFFIDNRNIRNYIKNQSKGKRVLNLCSFTATIGCLAKINGAKSVINLEKFDSNNELGKRNYNLNNLSYDDTEFITDKVENLNNLNFEHKFDLIILDFPEISVLPTYFKKTYNTYLSSNELVLKLLAKDGKLITTCCSHGFKRSRYNEMIDELKARNNLVEIEQNLESLIDHPVSNRNDYLKIKMLKKNSEVQQDVVA